MQRKFLFLGIIAILLVIIFFLVRFFVLHRNPRQGVLKVSTNVAARVLLNNRDIGKTPLEQKVDVGEYTIRLVPDSTTRTLSSWQGRVVIGGNTVSFINRDLAETELTSAGEQLWLEKISGNATELSILSVPDGASVLVNDQSRGVTPLKITDLPAGEHTVVVTSPGFDSRTTRVRLNVGYRVVASVFMAISPSQIANPIVTPEPSATQAATLQSAPVADGEASNRIAMPTATPTSAPTRTPTRTPTPQRTQSPTVASTVARVRILDTPIGFLRVRKEPSTAAEEIGRAEPGQEFSVIKQQGTWYNITFEQSSGWISAQYAEPVE